MQSVHGNHGQPLESLLAFAYVHHCRLPTWQDGDFDFHCGFSTTVDFASLSVSLLVSLSLTPSYEVEINSDVDAT